MLLYSAFDLSGASCGGLSSYSKTVCCLSTCFQRLGYMFLWIITGRFLSLVIVMKGFLTWTRGWNSWFAMDEEETHNNLSIIFCSLEKYTLSDAGESVNTGYGVFCYSAQWAARFAVRAPRLVVSSVFGERYPLFSCVFLSRARMCPWPCLIASTPAWLRIRLSCILSITEHLVGTLSPLTLFSPSKRCLCRVALSSDIYFHWLCTGNRTHWCLGLQKPRYLSLYS